MNYSPRFYGAQPPYYGNPADVNKELVQQAESSMRDLLGRYP
jgi:hypothetical protein